MMSARRWRPCVRIRTAVPDGTWLIFLNLMILRCIYAGTKVAQEKRFDVFRKNKHNMNVRVCGK